MAFTCGLWSLPKGTRPALCKDFWVLTLRLGSFLSNAWPPAAWHGRHLGGATAHPQAGILTNTNLASVEAFVEASELCSPRHRNHDSKDRRVFPVLGENAGPHLQEVMVITQLTFTEPGPST